MECQYISITPDRKNFYFVLSTAAYNVDKILSIMIVENNNLNVIDNINKFCRD